MKILAIDPGSKHIGLAISDPTGTISRPLLILHHRSRIEDNEKILSIALEEGVDTVIVGQSLEDDGEPSFEGRRSARMAESLKERLNIPIVLWNEGFSTLDARHTRIQAGGSRKKRRGHLDDVAAAIILQSYLDAQADGR